MIWAILATGPSMNQQTADYVRGKCKVIAVSDAYKLAPWADALVSYDSNWWRNNREALKFRGEKYSRSGVFTTKAFRFGITPGCNSGYMAMRVAESLGAKKIILLGYDMHGTHYFGKHPEPLKNTTPERFRKHALQFKRWRGCEVINCTPNTALHCFPERNLKEIL